MRFFYLRPCVREAKNRAQVNGHRAQILRNRAVKPGNRAQVPRNRAVNLENRAQVSQNRTPNPTEIGSIVLSYET